MGMKRFSFFLMALCVLGTASAEFGPLEVADLAASKAAAVAKYAPTSNPVGKQASFAAQRKEALLAAAETVAIDGALTAEQIPGYDEEEEWWVVITTKAYKVEFDIYSTTLAGTYTLEDVDPDYTVITDLTGEEEKTIYLSALSFTITQDVAADTIDLVGTATGSDGKTYTIHGHKNALPQPKDTIRLTYNEAVLTENNSDFQLYGVGVFPEIGTDSVYTKLSFYKSGKSIVGSYEYKNRTSLYANFVSYQGKTVLSWEKLNATITIDSGLYVCKAEIFGTDSILYQITLYTDAPEPLKPKKTVDFWATNLSIEDGTEYIGMAIFEASNSENYALIGVSTKTLYGSYTTDDISPSSVIIAGKDTLSILEAELTFENWNDQDMFFGKVIASDTVQYNILFSWEAPEAKDTVSITFAETGEGVYSENGKTLLLVNQNEQYVFSLDISTDSVGGAFTEKNLNTNSYIRLLSTEESAFVAFLTADVKITDTGNNTCSVVADILGADTIWYKVSSSFVYTVSKQMKYDSESDELDRTFTGADEITIAPVKGVNVINVLLRSPSAMDLIYVDFYVSEGVTTLPAGVYPIDHSKKANTVYACDGVKDGSLAPSFYAHFTEEGKVATPFYFLESGTVTVEYNGENTKITIDAKNSYNVPVHIVYDSSLTALDHTTETVPAAKYIRNGKLYIEAAGRIYDATGAVLK